MANYDVRLIIERMKETIRVKNDKDLAQFLNVQGAHVANWKSRNSLPLEYVTTFIEQTSINADWLLFGKEVQPQDSTEKIVLLAFNALTDQEKLKAIAFITGLSNQKDNEKSSQTVVGSAVQNMAGGNINIK